MTAKKYNEIDTNSNGFMAESISNYINDLEAKANKANCTTAKNIYKGKVDDARVELKKILDRIF